jgi:hypothetical protein
MAPARKLMLCSITLCGLLLAGCQAKSTTLNHVTGKVLFRGTPLHNGVIVFSPDTTRGESGKIAIGKIESNGTYTLKTDDALGVASGWYRVSVASLANPTASYDVASISVIPEKYRDPQLSMLQCEVKPNRDNHLDINLD